MMCWLAIVTSAPLDLLELSGDQADVCQHSGHRHRFEWNMLVDGGEIGRVLRNMRVSGIKRNELVADLNRQLYAI